MLSMSQGYSLPASEAEVARLPDLYGSLSTLLGVMTESESDHVLADLRRHLSKPETLMISYAMIQVTGRVPGP